MHPAVPEQHFAECIGLLLERREVEARWLAHEQTLLLFGLEEHAQLLTVRVLVDGGGDDLAPGTCVAARRARGHGAVRVGRLSWELPRCGAEGDRSAPKLLIA